MFDARSRWTRIVVVVLCCWLIASSGIGAVGGVAESSQYQSAQQDGDCGCVTIAIEQRGPLTVSKADKDTIKITYAGEERKSWTIHNKSIWRTPEQAGWPGDFDDLTLDEVEQLQDEIQGLEDSEDKGVYEDEIKPYLKSRETDGTLRIKSHNKSVPITVTMHNHDYFVVHYEEKSWRIPWNEISLEWGWFAEPGVERDQGIRDLLPNERDQLRKQIHKTEEYQYQIEDHITKDVGGDLKEVNKKEEVDESDSGILDVQGPVESFKDILEYAGNAFAKGVSRFVDAFHWVMLTVPAPGDVTKPTTWFPQNPLGVEEAATEPQSENQSGVNQTQQSNGTSNESSGVGPRDERRPPDEMQAGSWWPVVWRIYGGLAGLVGLPIAAAGIYAWSNTPSQREKDKRLKRVGVMVVMIVGGVVFIPLMLHLVNALALGIVPSGGEFLKTPGDFTKLGLGLVLGVAVVALEGGLIIIGLIVLFIQWILMYFVVAVWPLAAVCLGSNNRYLKPYGHTIMSVFAGLLILKLIQAIWLRFIFELPLSFSNPGGSLLTLGTITAGVLLAFIYLPLYTVKNLLPKVVTTLGQSSAAMGHRRRRTQYHHQPQYYDDHHQSLHRGDWHNGSRNYRTRSTQSIDSNGSWRDSGSQNGQQTILADYTIDSEQPEYPRRVRAVEWLGQNAKKGIELRRSAKSHWEGAKWYWSGMMPGNRYRGRLKPVRPLRNRMRGRVNQASDWWQDWKQRYETDNEEDSNE